MSRPQLPSEVLRTLLAFEGYSTNFRSFESMVLMYPAADWMAYKGIKEANVAIAKACYAERVLADNGDWYANQARKIPWEWAIAGGV